MLKTQIRRKQSRGGHHFVFYGFFSDYTVYRKKHFLLIVERMFRFSSLPRYLKHAIFKNNSEELKEKTQS